MGIQIPKEYEGKLEPIDRKLDNRTDEELYQSLLEYKPVTSEKNIWTFWDSGIDGMPAWCRRNVYGWIRICGPEWTIRVIDTKAGSPNHGAKFIPTGLPDAFYNDTMDGTHSGPHKADFLRGACLYTFGGAWVDSSTFMTRSMDEICWNQLADPASPYEVAVPVLAENLLNSFLAARKHDPFIKRWHDIFMHVWEGRTNPDGLAKHPLMVDVVPMFMTAFLAQMEKGMGIGLNVPHDALAEYGLQMVCWQRVAMLEDIGDGFDGPDYWQNKVIWMDCPQELVRCFYDFEVGVPVLQRGPEIFELLSMKYDDPAAVDTPQYKAAEKVVWEQLTNSSMLKIGTIKGMVDWVSLGTLWNRPENLGKDAAPGTFAEVLRTIPLHYKQVREGIYTLKSSRPATTIKKGALEP